MSYLIYLTYPTYFSPLSMYIGYNVKNGTLETSLMKNQLFNQWITPSKGVQLLSSFLCHMFISTHHYKSHVSKVANPQVFSKKLLNTYINYKIKIHTTKFPINIIDLQSVFESSYHNYIIKLHTTKAPIIVVDLFLNQI
jgi:hypothetical protein